MSDDIVTQLRRRAAVFGNENSLDIRAADEIERLRHRLERLAAYETGVGRMLEDIPEAGLELRLEACHQALRTAETEIERLRAELQAAKNERAGDHQAKIEELTREIEAIDVVEEALAKVFNKGHPGHD